MVPSALLLGLILFLIMDVVCEARNIEKSYSPQEPLFSQFSCKVDRGEILAVEGPNGSGKTTLLRLLAGAILPSQGQVLHDGRDTKALKRTLSVGYQPSAQPCFFGRLTGIQNLYFFAKQARVPKASLVDGFNLWRQNTTFSKALETRYFLCSSGMKRMLSLFRALCLHKDLIVLDEPFQFLDRPNEDFILQQILAQKNQSAIIFSSHQGQKIRGLADQVVTWPWGPVC